jgi:hypothetical protein
MEAASRREPSIETGPELRADRAGSKNRVGIWRYPPAIREAAAGIFVWPAWGLYDTIKGDMFKHNNFSHN